MGVLLQISAWAVTTMAAEYTFHKYLCPKEIKSDRSHLIPAMPNITETKIIQTMTWKIASQPNSLLFDFSGLEIDRQEIFDVIRSNLSPLVSTGVKICSENELLIELMLESSNILLLKQTRSILKHRGMKITSSVCLKPTSTLSFDNQVQYWMIRIFNLPLDTSLLLDQDEHKKKLSVAITNSFSQSAITVKPKNIHYETVTKLSNTILSGTVTVLIKEVVYKESIITANRRFVYLSCYKHQFPVNIKSLNRA